MPLANLCRVHHALLDCVAGLSAETLRRQYHPDLSPLGWHLGHVAYSGQYWLREVVQGDDSRTAGLHDRFLPEQIDKADRQRLAGIDDIPAMAASYRDIEAQLGVLLAEEPAPHPLLKEGYLGWFLLQHAAQHGETMHMVLQQREISIREGRGHRPSGFLAPEPDLQPVAELAVADVPVVSGRYRIGSSTVVAYDNECPPYDVHLAGFCIASQPVSNAQYLAFMLDGGYQREEFWSDAGRDWKQGCAVASPQHWYQDQGRWCQSTPHGPDRLLPAEAVNGISWYEADAFARYAGCRLPREEEWEAAMRTRPDLWATTGGAWEWCADTFRPYSGFRAFPYQRYSRPWFDGRHYVLRGAGSYTDDCVRRPGFRNFYLADKRYAFSGLRLAADS